MLEASRTLRTGIPTAEPPNVVDWLARRPAQHFICLDGLRGIAALLVVAWHISGYFQLAGAPAHAYLAVDFFFMLSGFVISHAYHRQLAEGLRLKQFITIRVTRLYPLIAAGLALGTLTWLSRVWLTGDVSAGSVLLATFTNALLLPTYALSSLRPFAFPINGPLWSLSWEMAINAAYAACFPFLSIRRLATLAVLGGMGVAFIATAHGSLDVGFFWSDFELGLGRVVYPFTMGILLRQRAGRHSRQTQWGHASAALLLLMLVCPLFMKGLFDLLAVIVVFPLTLELGSRASRSKMLDQAWARLGALSYPLYVLHYPIVAAVSNVAHQMKLDGLRLHLVAALCFLLVIVISLIMGRADKLFRTRIRHNKVS